MDTMIPEEAKAVKDYLISFKMTVPTAIQDLARYSTDKVSTVKQRTVFGRYNSGLRKPIWYRYCPIFEEVWKDYINQYGQSQYTNELRRCVEDVSDSLFDAAVVSKNKESRPKLLLGYVQSGKTQAFAFIATRCFDMGFDVCIVLTANKIALKNQTKYRFKDIFDINDVNLPSISVETAINQKELKKCNSKLILLINKNKTRLDNLSKLNFSDKRVLVIDDEADVISRGFYKANGAVTIAECAKAIENLRQSLNKTENAYLAVTATCYNLILQPVYPVNVIDKSRNSIRLAPLNPSEIFLLPTYPGYKGVDDFFGKNKKLVCHSLVLEPKYDLMEAIYTYLVGAAFLNLMYPKKGGNCTSCIVHLDVKNIIQSAVCKDIESIIDDLSNDLKCTKQPQHIKASYDDFKNTLNNTQVPTLANVVDWIKNCIHNTHINITVLNSQQEIGIVSGQIPLYSLCNIFIGGFMLDRGITFPHLITFIYARKSKQRDTVIQHARFFGNRSDEEMGVTRLFMPTDTADMMAEMHILDRELREDIKIALPGDRIGVIKTRAEEVCSKLKVLASDIDVIGLTSRIILPKGMQININTVTSSNRAIEKVLNNCKYQQTHQYEKYNKVNNNDIILILNHIKKSYDYSPKYNNDNLRDEMNNIIAVLKKYWSNHNTTDMDILLWKNRDLSRTTANGWSTGVLTGRKGGNTKSDSEIAKELADKLMKPVLVLTKQKGDINKGWTGHEFYWPVIVFPASNNTLENTETIQVKN